MLCSNCTEIRVSPNGGDYATIGVLSVLFIFGAPINLAVFFRLSEKYGSLGPAQILKLQLIIGDLMVLFLYAVSKICWHMTWEWRGGVVLCKAVKFSHELSFQFSAAILAAIGVHRCLLLARPFSNSWRSKRLLRVLIRFCWLYAIFNSLPNLFWFTVFTVPGTSALQCAHKAQFHKYQNESWSNLYTLRVTTEVWHMITIFWIPIIFMILAYGFILSYLHFQFQSIDNMSENSGCSRVSILRRTEDGRDGPRTNVSFRARAATQGVLKVLNLVMVVSAVVNPFMYGLSSLRSRHHRNVQYRLKPLPPVAEEQL